MRKTTYTIDDKEYFNRLLAHVENSEEIINNLNSFRALYTIIGNKYPEREILTDFDGNKINRNDLNAYQNSLLGGCYNHFEGRQNTETNIPTGCINIEVTENFKEVKL